MPGFDTVTISEKGQLVIPKFLRSKFQLYKGVKLAIFEENNKIILERADELLEKVKESEAHKAAALQHPVGIEIRGEHSENHAAAKPRDIKDAREIH